MVINVQGLVARAVPVAVVLLVKMAANAGNAVVAVAKEAKEVQVAAELNQRTKRDTNY
jgi:hypothetical protein